MIKKLAIFFWLIPCILTAQSVSVSSAETIARSMMGVGLEPLKTQLVQDSVLPFGNPGQPQGFVITFRPAGFVIVGGQESDPLILGFSIDTPYPSNPDHPLRSWLIPGYLATNGTNVPSKGSQGTKLSTDHFVLPLTPATWGQPTPTVRRHWSGAWP